jgi:hypothetical protein
VQVLNSQAPKGAKYVGGKYVHCVGRPPQHPKRYLWDSAACVTDPALLRSRVINHLALAEKRAFRNT